MITAKKGRKPDNVRQLILATLEEHPNLTMPDIACRVIASGISTKGSVYSCVSTMANEGLLVRSGIPGKYQFSVADDKQVVCRGAFCLPEHFTGPALSPMDWSMRHLLGA